MGWPPPPVPWDQPRFRYERLLTSEKIVWETTLFDLPEVADRLSTSLTRVRRLVRKGYLPAYRGLNGRQLFVIAADLLQYEDRYREPFDVAAAAKTDEKHRARRLERFTRGEHRQRKA